MHGFKKIEFGDDLWATHAPGSTAPTCTADGEIASARFVPQRGTIWCVSADLGDGARLAWDGEDRPHGEEVVYVVEGQLDVDVPDLGRRRCPTGGAVIVEAGVAASVVAAGASRVLHFGTTAVEPPADGPFGPPEPQGRRVRVIGAGGLAEFVGPGQRARYWADGSSPTCRVTLFESSRGGGARQAPHSHSVDEIFVITDGAIRVGRRTVSAGMAVFVAGDQRYAFAGGEAGYTMINYRPDASYYSLPGSDDRPLEGTAWPGITMVEDVIA